MREIKFRAWDKEIKCMISAEETMQIPGETAASAEMYIYLQLNGILLAYSDKRVMPVNWRYILMQYTGLKDKNGKKCYWDDWVTDGINPKFLVTPDYHLLARLSEIQFEILGNKYEME